MPTIKKKDVLRVARRVVESLEGEGYSCCLFGSAACSLWGMDRVPHDIDIVVFTRHTAEQVKHRLSEANNRIVLFPGRGDYTVPFYNISYPTISYPKGLRIKIDILTHGKRRPLGIPKIPQPRIVYRSRLPVMPFLPLLILKVQGWHDHRKSRQYKHRKKIRQDEGDIEELLSMARDDHCSRGLGWLPEWFSEKAEDLLREYVESFPESLYDWRSLGFDL